MLHGLQESWGNHFEISWRERQVPPKQLLQKNSSAHLLRRRDQARPSAPQVEPTDRRKLPWGLASATRGGVGARTQLLCSISTDRTLYAGNHQVLGTHSRPRWRQYMCTHGRILRRTCLYQFIQWLQQTRSFSWCSKSSSLSWSCSSRSHHEANRWPACLGSNGSRC